ncbi:MAG: hypothetical protein AB1921_04800, partial [Thermodesulfobacteriota bacterium]
DRDGIKETGEVAPRTISTSYSDIRVLPSQSTIHFDSRGAADANGSVILFNSQGSKAVSVNTVGRVKIVSFNAS